MPEYAIYVRKEPAKKGEVVEWHLFDPQVTAEVRETLCESLIVETDFAASIPIGNWATSQYRCGKCDELVGDALTT